MIYKFSAALDWETCLHIPPEEVLKLVLSIWPNQALV